MEPKKAKLCPLEAPLDEGSQADAPDGLLRLASPDEGAGDLDDLLDLIGDLPPTPPSSQPRPCQAAEALQGSPEELRGSPKSVEETSRVLDSPEQCPTNMEPQEALGEPIETLGEADESPDDSSLSDSAKEACRRAICSVEPGLGVFEPRKGPPPSARLMSHWDFRRQKERLKRAGKPVRNLEFRFMNHKKTAAFRTVARIGSLLVDQLAEDGALSKDLSEVEALAQPFFTFTKGAEADFRRLAAVKRAKAARASADR